MCHLMEICVFICYVIIKYTDKQCLLFSHDLIVIIRYTDKQCLLFSHDSTVDIFSYL